MGTASRYERLTQADPQNTQLLQDLAGSHERLGAIAVASNDLAAARARQEIALDIRKRLVETDPSNTDWHWGLAIGYSRMGDVALASLDLKAARANYHSALPILQTLAGSDRANAQWRRDLVACHQRHALLESFSGNIVGARDHLKTMEVLFDLLLTLRKGGATAKEACQMHMVAASIEKRAGDNTAVIAHHMEARRLLALLDARGEFQGDVTLDRIRKQLTELP